MKMEERDLLDLLEMRSLLEIEIARLAAERRTIDDIVILKNAIQAFQCKVQAGESGVAEYLLVHLKMADAAKNNTLKSLILIVVIKLLKADIYCIKKGSKVNRLYKSVKEHEQIFEHILNQETNLAAQVMKNHLRYI